MKSEIFRKSPAVAISIVARAPLEHEVNQRVSKLRLPLYGISASGRQEHDATAVAPFEGGTTLKPRAGTRTLVPNEPLEVLMLKVVVNPGLVSSSEADTYGKKTRAGE